MSPGVFPGRKTPKRAPEAPGKSRKPALAVAHLPRGRNIAECKFENLVKKRISELASGVPAKIEPLLPTQAKLNLQAFLYL